MAAPLKIALQKTDEKNKRLYKTYDGTTFQVDTGADFSVIKPTETHGEFKKLIVVADFDGHEREKAVWGKGKIDVIIGTENLLSPDDLVKIGRLGVVDQNKEIERIVREAQMSDKGELEKLLRKYMHAYAKFKNDCGRVQSKYEHVIQGGIPPPQRQYKINSAAEKEIGMTIKELAEQGVIRKLGKNETAVTNAPIQAVSKPDGSWRLVTNYKALNKVTVPDTRYLINCSEASGEVGREKNWLSKIDLANGFWSVPLAEESKGKTAFTYNGDQYIYNNLPQGLDESECIPEYDD